MRTGLPKRFPVLLGFVTMASIIAAPAQQAKVVSLRDTLLWLHKFVADYGSQDSGQSSIDNHTCRLGTANCQERQDVSTFDSVGCSATITWSVTLNRKNIITYIYSVSLKDLDPKSVSWVKEGPFANAVEADTANHRAAVRITSTLGGGYTPELGGQSWVDVGFDSGEHAKRFAEVFQHAIRLCGGKSSPF